MAKARIYRIPWEDPNYYVGICHWGPQEPWDPETLHTVYAYDMTWFPPNLMGYFLQFTLEDAMHAARTFVAMPMIARDLCFKCRNYQTGPTVPRWNIYRGENKMATPRVILWNDRSGPPPGY